MLWNDTKGNTNVSSECEEDEGTDREDGDSDINWTKQIESDVLRVLSV